MEPQFWVSLSAVVVTILVHIVITVWWAAKTSTILSLMQTDFQRMITQMETMNGVYFTKEAASRELALADKEHKAIWRKIDDLQLLVKQGEGG